MAAQPFTHGDGSSDPVLRSDAILWATERLAGCSSDGTFIYTRERECSVFPRDSTASNGDMVSGYHSDDGVGNQMSSVAQ